MKTQSPATRLAIDQIAPVDLDDPAVAEMVAATAAALTRPHLREILAVRTAIQHFLSAELAIAGYVHPPIYMLSGCTDPLNHQTFPARLNYYGEEVSVTQSLILQKILMVMLSPVEQVFWASPNIRMEMGVQAKRYKYAAEFMQVDFEKKGATMAEMISFIGGLVSRLHRHLNQTQAAALQTVRGSLLPELPAPLAVHDVAEVKAAHGLTGDDEVERHLAEQAQGLPFIVTNLKREAYDCLDQETGRYLNYDVVYPGCGDNPHPVECLSGAERTRSLPDLRARMIELGYPMEYFAPFFAIFQAQQQSGSAITCAGGGFGIERLTYALLGLKDVHQVYPFPRPAEGCIAI
ncbi:MAG: hypothetical protein QNL91_00360 [Candidatus Krumholzibacteria bacterium]|nr:hypothetical protein [Candidatus Krumholzibacteria bacterium]